MFDIKGYIAQIGAAADFIRSRQKQAPKVGIICGTGMGALADKVEGKIVVPYKEIPHFPLSTVESHSGNLMLGTLAGKPVMVMQGRFHFYEGYTMKQVTFPVRVMKALECEVLVVMNAVGSMNPLIPRGSIVLVDDMINAMGDNPLLGPNDDSLGPRFPDMSEPFDKKLRATMREVALENKIALHEGVMVSVAGPNLETRAEYRMFRRAGADIITMSTVPETLVARHAGMRVIALSTVTDNCLPDALEPAELSEIIKVAQSAEPRLETLVTGLLGRI